MGLRGELFSTKVALQNRTYFFNVKENRLGDLYLNIVESKNRDEGGFERQSVILFADDLQDFLLGFDESLRVLEKAAREKRRGKGAPSRGRESDRDFGRERRENRDYQPRGNRDFERGDRKRYSGSFETGRKSDETDRKPGFSRDPSGPESRHKRYGNKDNRERRPSNHRSDDKREFSPRKKKVFVRKK